MGYIESKDHFLNYLNKAVQESDAVDDDRLLSAEFYVSKVYDQDKADALTWEIHNNGAQVLHEEEILEWLSDHTYNRPLQARFKQEMTGRFQDLVDELSGISGVYCFCNEEDTALYVGRSIDLGTRLWTSAQRFSNEYNRDIYVRIIADFNPADSAVIEMYFINKYKPAYNGNGMFNEELTIELSCTPEWTDPIKAIRSTESD